MDRVVKRRVERDRWSDMHELLAVIADHVGVSASGRTYEEPRKRIRRPGEADPNEVKAVSYGDFARMLTRKAA